MTLRALITRPEEDAAPLAAALDDRGIAATVEPLLTIRPLADAAIDLAGVQALLFTSANGVRVMATLANERNLTGWRDLPVYAVGNATAAAARDAGFTRIESAAGDVAALARLVAARLDPTAGALFHAAGSAVAGDLSGLLEQAGFTVRRAVLYEAEPADQLSPSTVTALANGTFDLVLFFSPRTAATFVTLVRSAGEGVTAGCRKATALCLSPAVAAAIAELPWHAVQVATRPELPALLDLVDRALGVDANATPPPPRPETPHAAVVDVAPPRRSRAALVTAALIVVAAAAAFALGWWTSPPGPNTDAAVAKLDSLEQQLAAATADLAKSKEQVASLTAATATLEDELKGVKAAMPAPSQPPDLKPLTDRIAALESKLSTLESQPAANGAPAPADIERLTAENAQLRNELAALKTQLDALGGLAPRLDALDQAVKSRTADSGGAAIVLAVSHLGSALATGQPFRPELDALTAIAAADPAVAADVKTLTQPFADRAAVGVPTLVDLQARFPATAKAIAAAAQQSTSAEPGAEGWMNRVLGWLDTTVRPVGDVPGDDPKSRVARAETRLAAGELAAAVDELKGIDGPPATAAAPWLADAEARLAADHAAGALQLAAAARLSQAAAPANAGN